MVCPAAQREERACLEGPLGSRGGSGCQAGRVSAQIVKHLGRLARGSRLERLLPEINVAFLGRTFGLSPGMQWVDGEGDVQVGGRFSK